MSDFRKLWLLFQLRRNAWRKTEDLLKIQEKKLRAIIKHAYENVEFYHKKFDSLGLKPSDVKNVEDLKKLPMISKKEIRDNYPEGIVAKGVDIRKCKTYRTSGSTGIPLTILLDKSAEDYRAALFGRPFFECGLGLRDRMVEIVDERHVKRDKEWYQRLGLLGRLYVPATQSVDEQMPLIAAYKPDAIFGYSSWLHLLAKTMRKAESKQLSPRLVFSTAEILTQEQRKCIESTFEVDVLDFYGCVEVERVAWECREQVGYHMDVDCVATEFVKDDEEVSPGERGNLILTCLCNYAMPLIRYNIGDIAVPTNEKCTCGRGLPLMKNIEGRADDMVIAPSGKILVPENFAQMMRAISGIGQYKVIQQKKDEIIVQIVKGTGFSQNTVKMVREEIKRILGSDVHVKTFIVNEVERDNSGKLRAVVTKVPIC